MTRKPPPDAGRQAEGAGFLRVLERAERHVLWVVELLPSERVTYASPAAERIWGRTPDELCADARLWVAGIHPDDRARVVAAYEHWLRDPAERRYDIEFRVVRPDGSMSWVHDTGEAMLSPQGVPLRLSGIAEDITERKLALEALRAEKDKLAALVATAPTVVNSFHRAPDGRMWYEFGADRVAELFGASEAQLRDDAGRVFAQFVPPEDQAVAQAASLRSALEMRPWQAEYRVMHPTRGERWLEGNAIPRREADGGMSWYGALTDITERKRTEQALRDSEARLAAVFDHMSQGLVVCTPDGRLFDWNPAALRVHGFAHQAEAHISLDQASRSFEVRTLDGELLPATRWPLPRALAGETIHQLELRVRHLEQGWEKVLSYDTARVLDADGRLTLVIGQVRDVSKRRAAEDEVVRLNSELEHRVAERTTELRAAVKELEAFSYSVSHDLRAPLRALDGFSQALIEDHGASLPEDGRRYLGIIRATAQKMGRLIDDLLNFARLSRQPLVRRSVETEKLVRNAYETLAAQREGRCIDFRVAALPDCEADLALLRQVWINLLANAIKYTRRREPALVEVGCGTTADGRVEYFVRDNGAGFDMRYVHKLFGVFERLHRAEEFEGTGVGLAIVQRIVQRHGGTVRAEGEPDRGASFYFTLG